MTAPYFQRLSGKLWAKREAKCLSIIQRALETLQQSKDLPESEIELNRSLYFHLLKASRELFPNDLIPPIPECNNLPDPDDDARARREHKRPDFQWIYLDQYELDPQRASKQFVVECKRLGEPPSRNWILNFNYVENGIKRFLLPDWAYAKRAPSGAMVGYWQSMKCENVLKEVNGTCSSHAIQSLDCIDHFSTNTVIRSEHEFDRPFPISPFRLHHLWIDLRSPCVSGC